MKELKEKVSNASQKTLEDNCKTEAVSDILPQAHNNLEAAPADFLAAVAAIIGLQNQAPPLERVSRDGTLPVSFAQERFWILDQLAPNNPFYNESVAFRISGKLNVTALEQSFKEILRRHEALRTSFTMVDGELIQVISSNWDFNLSIVDVTTVPNPESNIQTFITKEVKKPFNLKKGLLLRPALLKLGEEDWVLVVAVHHIVFDKWSESLLFEELTSLYKAFSTDKPSTLPELPIQYADFAHWQLQWLKNEVLDEQLDYWQQQLGGSLPRLQLPTDYPCLPNRDYRGAKKHLVLSTKLTEALKTLSRQESATLFMTLLAAFKTLLYRYTGEEDIIVGTPVAGRNQIKTEKLMGCFLNSLAMRSDLSGNPTFVQLLHRVREVVQQAYAHQDIPFEKVLEKLDLDRSHSHSPVFDVMLNLLNTPQQALELSGLTLTPLELLEPDSQFSMTLYVEEHGSELHLILLYQQALFSSERMVCLLNQFQYLLEEIVANPEKPLKSYSLVTPQSRSLLPDQSVALPEPHYEPVTNLFASWVKSTPQHPAISQGNRTWSYSELSTSAYALAQVLRSKGIEKGEPVAVCGSRSFGLIASIIGILLNGSVLLTIDQNLPQQRQRLILTEAKAKYLLSVGEQLSADKWMDKSVKIINIAEDTGRAVEAAIDKTQARELPERVSEKKGGEISKQTRRHGDAETRRMEIPPKISLTLPEITPEDPAYIFFTSGTTGVPKGVLGVHKGLSHFLDWQRQTFDVTQKDRIAQLTSLSFDAVLRDIFLPLTSGATLCLLEATADLSSYYILPWLARERISLLHTVPTLAQSWLVDKPSGVSVGKLRRVFFSGEPLTAQLIHQWREAFPEAEEIINLYGPTETTMVKFYYRVPAAQPLPAVQPVGYPQPSTQGLILGENNQLCGIAEPGQIVIRTPFRTLGYINAPEANHRQFVKNPNRDDKKDLLYYTGDRGRYRPDGSIEILGRIDHQVKIGGVRIEPGEIEAVLNQYPAVGQSLILAQEITPGNKCLVAYIVLNREQACTNNELRDFLQQRLPNLMIPSAFVMLDAFPRTPNGKVDRRALPVPDLTEPQSPTDFVAPRDQLERELTKIWKKVLGIQSIGVKDNFFDLGGNSLLAVSVIAKIQKTFDKNLSLATLFQEASTIEQLANSLRHEGWSAPESSLIPIQPGGSKNPFFFINSLAYAQKLSSYLGSDQPCYGLSIFRLMNLDQQKIDQLQIGDIAEQFIKDMRTIQPDGPYLLGVYCGDFRIALEIAQQLHVQRQKVGLLAFIDAIWDPRKLGFYFYWHNFRQFGFSYLLYKVNQRIEFIKNKLILHIKSIKSKFYSQTGSTMPKHLQDVNLLNAYYQFGRDYVPQVYPGKLTFFVSSEWRLRNSGKLESLAGGGLETHEIHGYHKNLFEEPQILVLAEKLKACLDNAQED